MELVEPVETFTEDSFDADDVLFDMLVADLEQASLGLFDQFLEVATFVVPERDYFL